MSRVTFWSYLATVSFIGLGPGTESFAGWGRGPVGPPHGCWAAPRGHYKTVTVYEYRKIPHVTVSHGHRCRWHRPIVTYKLVKVPVRKLVWCEPGAVSNVGPTSTVAPGSQTPPGTAVSTVTNPPLVANVNSTLPRSTNGTGLPDQFTTRVAGGINRTPIQSAGSNSTPPAFGGNGTAPALGSGGTPAAGSNGTPVRNFNGTSQPSVRGQTFQGNSFRNGGNDFFRGGGNSSRGRGRSR